MNVDVKRLNHICQPDKDVVSGYIRNLRDLLPKSNAYYDMPINMQHIILFFYYHGIKFNTKYNQDCFQFADYDTTVKTKENLKWEDYFTCFIDDKITNNDCNIFNLHIKWLNGGDHFLMGYITSAIKEFDKSESRWIGATADHEHTGYGICFGTSSKDMHLYDKDNMFKKLKPSKNDYKIGDIFILSFNFINNQLIIKHNKDNVNTLSLHGAKKIIPGFAFRSGITLQIVKYEFLW